MIGVCVCVGVYLRTVCHILCVYTYYMCVCICLYSYVHTYNNMLSGVTDDENGSDCIPKPRSTGTYISPTDLVFFLSPF